MTQEEDISDKRAKRKISQWWQDYKPSTVYQKAEQLQQGA